ncbi:MAG: TipAS antibiotic-recognition domain-containing protein [Coriobacteriales bacterium]|nr:TipAS antibiotic-recognition domain-containing protein [Coriobacteriales bacterium]
MALKDTLLRLRKDAGLTQDQMAAKLYVTRQAISRWESGENSPSLDTLKLISQVFGISAYALLELPEPSAQELDLAPRVRAIAANERAYGSEARARFGDDVVDAANERLMSLSQEEWEDAQALEKAILVKLAEVFANGAGDPRSLAAMELCYMHEQWLKLHWPAGLYSPQTHMDLAQGYLADDRFVAYYDNAVAPGATRFLVSAIENYCCERA